MTIQEHLNACRWYGCNRHGNHVHAVVSRCSERFERYCSEHSEHVLDSDRLTRRLANAETIHDVA